MAASTTDAASLPTAEEAAAAAAEAAAAAAEAEAIAKEAKEVDTSNPSAAPDRVKRAEAVLRLRTDRVAVVLECPASVSVTRLPLWPRHFRQSASVSLCRI